MPSTLPMYPWQKIGCDLCEIKGKTYLVTIDYYSRYLELAHMKSTSAFAVIHKLKDVFARWGIPQIVRSDNGPQFASNEFSKFSENYGFKHITSSPHFPTSNGEAEHGVQTAKKILACNDPFLALMSYRATPVASLGYSPAQLLIGRQIRTLLPSLTENLKPKCPDESKVRENDNESKIKQSKNYNKRNSVVNHGLLQPGEKVRIKLDNEKQWSKPANVISQTEEPRSYLVESDGKIYRRNRRHLMKVPDNTDMDQIPEIDNAPPVNGIEHNTQQPGGEMIPVPEPRRSQRVHKTPQRLIETC
jgi:hypothetical protein